MTDTEKRAHDLAILYMQAEIKHDDILPVYTNGGKPYVVDLVSHYNELIETITEKLNNPNI